MVGHRRIDTNLSNVEFFLPIVLLPLFREEYHRLIEPTREERNRIMATAKERHLVTERYLADLKALVPGTPRLEENDMNMLHMNTPIEGWREWIALTYNHNVLADWLVRENEELHKIKGDLETKIKMLSPPAAPHLRPCPPSGHNDLLIRQGPDMMVMAAEVETRGDPAGEEEH